MDIVQFGMIKHGGFLLWRPENKYNMELLKYTNAFEETETIIVFADAKTLAGLFYKVLLFPHWCLCYSK